MIQTFAVHTQQAFRLTEVVLELRQLLRREQGSLRREGIGTVVACTLHDLGAGPGGKLDADLPSVAVVDGRGDCPPSAIEWVLRETRLRASPVRAVISPMLVPGSEY